jgi:hypothetical protein
MPTKEELVERIRELESCLSFYADADNYKIADGAKASKIAGDAFGAFARVLLEPDLRKPLRGPGLAKALGAEYRGKVSTGGGHIGAMQTLGEVQALRGLSPVDPMTLNDKDFAVFLENALCRLLYSFGEYVRQSMYNNREWQDGIEAADRAVFIARKRRGPAPPA